jgi:hypothetical protein
VNIVDAASAPFRWTAPATRGPEPWVAHEAPVARTTVYWRAGPMLYGTLAEAVAFCESNDFLPELMISAVPAAESADGHHYRLLEDR